MESLFIPAFNFTLFAALIFFLLKDKVKVFVRERHETLQTTITDVRRELQSAQEKFNEFESKLAAVGAETSAISNQFKKNAEEMKTQIIGNAKQNSSSMISQARSNSTGLLQELKLEMRTNFGVKIVQRAEEMISKKITGDDRARMRKEFAQDLGSEA